MNKLCIARIWRLTHFSGLIANVNGRLANEDNTHDIQEFENVTNHILPKNYAAVFLFVVIFPLFISSFISFLQPTLNLIPNYCVFAKQQ